MVAATVETTYAKNGYWALYTNDTMGGGETELDIPGDLPNITGYGFDLRVDGFSMQLFRAVGAMVVSPRIYSFGADYVTHFLDAFTTTAATLMHKHYAPLGIATTLRSNTPFIRLAATGNFNVADIIHMSAWGVYTRPEPEPQGVEPTVTPVVLDGIRSLRRRF